MKQAKQMMGRALVSALVLWWMATAGWSQSITWLGTLGGDGSLASGVSADGSVVVGIAYNADGQYRAFRWTVDGGMQDLGTLGGRYSRAYGVSADGSVVVGVAQNAAGWPRAFRWTVDGGMQDLGTLGGRWSEAYDVSADGFVVVGWSPNAARQYRAFRWTVDGGMQDLGTLPGGGWSVARGVSADGSVVVGVAQNAAGDDRAFRWTAAGGMQDLGTLLGGVHSWAYGVSADGSVVVGGAENAAGQGRAFRWTASGGMEDLNTTYASLLTNGSILWEARAISPDGRYIVGTGYNAATGRDEAFLLDTGQGTPPPTLTLTPATATQQALCPHTLTATLTRGAGEAVPNVRVRFAVVEGANAGVSGECVTGSDGRCDFSYVGERVGRDRVVAVAEVAGQVVRAEANVEWTPALIWLGTLGGSWSEAFGVSADGRVVVGRAYNAAGQYRAFRWTVAGGMQDLGTLLGDTVSQAFGVSADGLVVVGVSGSRNAFRWTAEGGMEGLPGGGTVRGVSSDGRVVVGWSSNGSNDMAVRWVWGSAGWEVENMGTLGGSSSWAYGVSSDGRVVVGRAYSAAGDYRAFRWTAADGMQDLGTLGGRYSVAYGVSADGLVVVGWAWNTARRQHAFRWTAADGMQDLGTLGGNQSVAYGVSADGAVVGSAQNVAGQERVSLDTCSWDGGLERHL
jgi:probable HAF family extracellular repeat protein